jgi:hypothetical protein
LDNKKKEIISKKVMENMSVEEKDEFEKMTE